MTALHLTLLLQSPAPCNLPTAEEQFHYHVNWGGSFAPNPPRLWKPQFLPGLTRLYTSLFSPAFHSTSSSSPLHSPCSSQTSLLTILGAHQAYSTWGPHTSCSYCLKWSFSIFSYSHSTHFIFASGGLASNPAYLTILSLCCPLLLLPSIFPSIRVFSNESALRIRWLKCHLIRE